MRAVRGAIENAGVEVEVGYRWRRARSAALFASDTHFRDDSVFVSNGVYVPASIITVTDGLMNAGARVDYHVGKFWYGAGLGLGIEDMIGYHGMRTTNVLRSVEARIGYRFAKAGRFDGQIAVLIDESGRSFDGSRELMSGRLVIGLQL